MKSDTSTHAYFPVDDAAIAMGFYITGAGREVTKPHQSYPPTTHPDIYTFSWNTGRVLPEYQLIYVYAGRGEFESRETGLIKVASGTAFLLMPDVWHRYRPASAIGWTEDYISFNGQIPHIWQRAGLINPATAVRKLAEPEQLAQSLERIIQAAVENPNRPPQAVAILALMALATALAGDAAMTAAPGRMSDTIESGSTEDAVVRAGLDLIWNHSHRNLSVHSIAHRLGITERTLARHFLAVRKRTVLDELTACRLSRACRLLRDTHLQIKRIAYAAGFSSPELLTAVFQRELNMTPTAYRVQKLSGESNR